MRRRSELLVSMDNVRQRTREIESFTRRSTSNIPYRLPHIPSSSPHGSNLPNPSLPPSLPLSSYTLSQVLPTLTDAMDILKRRGAKEKEWSLLYHPLSRKLFSNFNTVLEVNCDENDSDEYGNNHDMTLLICRVCN
jgi:hypothetical protein